MVLALALTASPAATAAPVGVANVDASDVGFAEAGAAASTLGGDALVALDAITDGGWRPSAPGVCHLPATAPPLSAAECGPLVRHSGRAPPLV